MTSRIRRPYPYQQRRHGRSRSWLQGSLLVPIVLFPLMGAMWLCWPWTLPPDASAASAPAATPGTITHPMDVRYQLRGYFYAGGRSEGLGGFATSDNVARPTTQNPGRVTLLALPAARVPFDRYDGYRVLLINGTRKEFKVEAEDSRLPMVHEAKDAQGNWQAIEYLPHSWCGNSYHDLFLPARHQWEFAAPHYTGAFATSLRLRLDTPDGPIYSNEFAGAINPEQLAADNKQGHAPSGLMDPYNE